MQEQVLPNKIVSITFDEVGALLTDLLCDSEPTVFGERPLSPLPTTEDVLMQVSSQRITFTV